MRQPNLNIDDDLFDAGATSLEIVQFEAWIEDEFGVQIGVHEVYLHRNIRTLVVELEPRNFRAPQRKTDHLLERDTIYDEPTPAQATFFRAIEFTGNEPVYYSVPCFKLSGSLDIFALKEAFRLTVSRHRALRSRFWREGGKIIKEIIPFIEVRIEEHEVTGDGLKKLRELISQVVEDGIALDHAPLFRINYVRDSNGFIFLGIIIHHIIADGIGISNWLNEIGETYSNLIKGCPIEPSTSIHENTYLQWRHTAGNILLQEAEFWRNELRDINPVMPLVSEQWRHLPARRMLGTFEFALGTHHISIIQSSAINQKVSVFCVIAALWFWVIYAYTGRTVPVIRTAASARSAGSFGNIVGMLWAPILLRVNIENGTTFNELINDVAERVRVCQRNVNLSQEQMRDALLPELDLSKDAPNVYLNVNQGGRLMKLDGVSVERCNALIGNHGADLKIRIFQCPEYIEGVITYVNDALDEAWVRGFYNAFIRAVEIIGKDPLITVADARL